MNFLIYKHGQMASSYVLNPQETAEKNIMKSHDITEPTTRRGGDGRGGGLLLRASNINLR